ncbi:MAG: thioesterase [bacterium]|nr:thioesterase [bacterium]
MSNLKLFCFPYAGGAAAGYNIFKEYLPESIQLVAPELAARGRRMREANYNSIDDAVDDIYNTIKGDLSQGPYAFYGHSMGSMIAFELTYKILKNGLPGPVHIFFSGRMAPHLSREGKKNYHHLTDEKFKKDLLELGGTPRQFFEHPELLEVFLPLMRGDFRLTETYTHLEKEAPLDCNITVLAGKEDVYSVEEMEAWKIHTSKQCTIHYFEGGHFFLNDEPQRVVSIIKEAIAAEQR